MDLLYQIIDKRNLAQKPEFKEFFFFFSFNVRWKMYCEGDLSGDD